MNIGGGILAAGGGEGGVLTLPPLSAPAYRYPCDDDEVDEDDDRKVLFLPALLERLPPPLTPRLLDPRESTNLLSLNPPEASRFLCLLLPRAPADADADDDDADDDDDDAPPERDGKLDNEDLLAFQLPPPPPPPSAAALGEDESRSPPEMVRSSEPRPPDDGDLGWPFSTRGVVSTTRW